MPGIRPESILFKKADEFNSTRESRNGQQKFRFVAPVPERQYIPVVLDIVIAGIFLSLSEKKPGVIRGVWAGKRVAGAPSPASIPAVRDGSGGGGCS
jgi:hypothetical protein